MTQIALLTDFGTTDIYVGVMKGVIHRICLQTRCIDISHAIQPQNVRQGAFALLNAYSYFAEGTIFLVVVDPGVGSIRRPLAVQAGGYRFIIPDNGILTYVLAELDDVKIVELANSAYQLPVVSNTFHGRDIFAPAAAHLAAGVPIDELGPESDTLLQLSMPQLNVTGQNLVGEVLSIDQFGNIETSIGNMRWDTEAQLTLTPRFGDLAEPVAMVAKQVSVNIRGIHLESLLPSYSAVAPGDLLALVSSGGYLEIAVNQGNAAAQLDVQVGDQVKVQLGDAVWNNS